MVPLTTRVGAFSALRALLLGAVLAVWWAAPSLEGEPAYPLVPLSLVYAVLAATLEVARRLAGRLPRGLIALALLGDGAYLVAAATLTGGPDGPLGFLVLAHIIAATLVASYRTGLKLVIWNSLLLAVVYSAQRAGLVDAPAPSPQRAVTAVAVFSFIALVTAACSALNERELRRGRAAYRALATMAADIQRLGDPEAIGPVLAQAVEGCTGCPRVAVALRPDGDGELRCWTSAGGVATSPSGTAEAGVARRCWQDRTPVLTRALDPDHDRFLGRALPDARNVVVLPLVGDDAPIGLLAVERGGSRRARIPASTVALLEQFAAHASLAYVNARLQERLRRLAALDGLTQLANRRMFDQTLRREVQRAERDGRPLTVLMLDVDYFKRVNDHHGHLTGDEVLRRVARTIQDHVRGSDVAARYGGEEFAVLLPACDAAGGSRVAEELRAAVAGVADPVRVTVSVGVASLPQDAGSAVELVSVADQGLYRAKAAGRNRVVCASEPAATA